MTTTPTVTPATGYSLTDPHTWVMILTSVVAVVADIFHQSFAAYVPATATLAAGLVVAFVALGKHNVRAALVSSFTATAAASTQTTGLDPALAKKLADLGSVASDLASLATGPTVPATTPTVAPSTAAQSPVVYTAAPAAPPASPAS